MTQDKFVQLMVESGLARYVQTEKTCVSNALERFADLVAAHERESCAKVCEEFGEWRDTSGVDCAEAIRARGEK